MSAPRRIQRSRAKGWRMPPKTVYVGRPGLFGNPFQNRDRLAAENARMREAILAAFDCGMVPKSSAADGGANKHVRQVRVADMLRAAINPEPRHD